MSLAAFVLAALVDGARFCSPRGEFCVVMQPQRATVYRMWPSGNADLLYELTPEWPGPFLVSDDGFVVSYANVRCDRNAKLLTIRSTDGAIVRTLNVKDVFTRHDQYWLCRTNEVRWSMGSALQATVLVTDTEWDDPHARLETIDIDVATGDVLSPMRDLCPDAVRIEASPDALLASAIHRETPEYPEVAIKARVTGVVEAQVVVGADGTVQSVTITKPIPFSLDEEVRRALMQWTFAPQLEPATGTIAFRFEILRNPIIKTTATECHWN